MNLNEYMTKANVTQTTLGEALGVSQGAVGQWTLPGRRIPAKHCPAIEKFTDRQVTCEELRPDIDWAYLRNTSSEAPQSSVSIAAAQKLRNGGVRKTLNPESLK